MQRYFFAGAAEAEPDKQGRVMLPAHAARDTRGSGARSSSPGSTTTSRSGIAPPGATTQGGRRERGGCCRTSCSPTRLTTFPSWRTRSGAPRRRARARPSSTHVRRRRPRGAARADLRGRGKLIAIDRDPTVRPYFERLRRAGGVQTPLPARRLLDRARAARRKRRRAPTRSCSTSASRACSSTGPSAASRTRPTRRSTCAWIRRPSCRARELVNEARRARAREHLPPLRRGALRAADRARDRPPPPRAAVRAHRRARRDDQGGDPGARAVRRRPSGQARLPGAADRRQRRARRARAGACRRRSRCCGRAAGSP